MKSFLKKILPIWAQKFLIYFYNFWVYSIYHNIVKGELFKRYIAKWRGVLIWYYLHKKNRLPSFVKRISQETYWPKRLEDDYTFNKVKDPYYERLAKDFFDLIKMEKPNTVLEVGCYYGHRTHVFAKRAEGIKFIGADLNPESIEFGQKRLPKLKNLKLEVQDTTNLTYMDNSFDVVYSFVSLTHIPHELIDKGIQEVIRVARNKLVLLEIDYFSWSLEMQWGVQIPDYMYFHNYTRLLSKYGNLERVIRFHYGENEVRYVAFIVDVKVGKN